MEIFHSCLKKERVGQILDKLGFCIKTDNGEEMVVMSFMMMTDDRDCDNDDDDDNNHDYYL